MDRETLRKEVIRRIEEKFADSIVLWQGIGLPDEEDDDTEQFEALWITDDDYQRFLDFKWKLVKELAKPNDFSIMVQRLSPDATKKYRSKEYKWGILNKAVAFYHTSSVSHKNLVRCSIKSFEIHYAGWSNPNTFKYLDFLKNPNIANRFGEHINIYSCAQLDNYTLSSDKKELEFVIKESKDKTDCYSYAA